MNEGEVSIPVDSHDLPATIWEGHHVRHCSKLEDCAAGGPAIAVVIYFLLS